MDNVENLNMTAAEEAFFKPRFPASTHGMYAFAADGTILARGGGYEAAGTRRMLREALSKFTPPASVEFGREEGRGSRRTLPEGGLALAVSWKVLESDAVQSSSTTGDGRYDAQFRDSLGSDRLWTTREEAAALAAGTVPATFARRIARDALSYALAGRVKDLELTIEGGRIRGRCPDAELLGVIETKDGKVTRLDLAVRGWGERVSDCGFSASLLVVPEGKRVPVGVLLSLVDPASDAGRIPPHRIRGENYYR